MPHFPSAMVESLIPRTSTSTRERQSPHLGSSVAVSPPPTLSRLGLLGREVFPPKFPPAMGIKLLISQSTWAPVWPSCLAPAHLSPAPLSPPASVREEGLGEGCSWPSNCPFVPHSPAEEGSTFLPRRQIQSRGRSSQTPRCWEVCCPGKTQPSLGIFSADTLDPRSQGQGSRCWFPRSILAAVILGPSRVVRHTAHQATELGRAAWGQAAVPFVIPHETPGERSLR